MTQFPNLMRVARHMPRAKRDQIQQLVRAASRPEKFRTQEGTEFKIRTTDFAKFLTRGLRVRPGAPLGEYLREDRRVRDEHLPALRSYGAEYEDPRKDYPDINKLWEDLLGEVRKSVRGHGADAGDWYVRDPSQSADDMEEVFSAASGDMSQNLEYVLEGRALDKYEDFLDVLRSGEFESGPFEDWSARYRKTLLGEIWADAWYGEMVSAWKRLRRNEREMARLNEIRSR